MSGNNLTEAQADEYFREQDIQLAVDMQIENDFFELYSYKTIALKYENKN